MVVKTGDKHFVVRGVEPFGPGVRHDCWLTVGALQLHVNRGVDDSTVEFFPAKADCTVNPITDVCITDDALALACAGRRSST